MLDGLARRLKKRQRRIDGLCEKMVGIGFQAIQLAFEQGDDLMEVKTSLHHGEFVPWVEKHFGKGIRTAQRYMAMAQIPKASRVTFFHDYKNLKELYLALGILPPEAPKPAIDLPRITIAPDIQRLTWLADFYERNPIKAEAMNPIQRTELKSKLRPIVAIYEAL